METKQPAAQHAKKALSNDRDRRRPSTARAWAVNNLGAIHSPLRARANVADILSALLFLSSAAVSFPRRNRRSSLLGTDNSSSPNSPPFRPANSPEKSYRTPLPPPAAPTLPAPVPVLAPSLPGRLKNTAVQKGLCARRPKRARTLSQRCAGLFLLFLDTILGYFLASASLTTRHTNTYYSGRPDQRGAATEEGKGARTRTG